MEKLLFCILIITVQIIHTQRMVFSSSQLSQFDLDKYTLQSTLIGEPNATTQCRSLRLQIESKSYDVCITYYNVTFSGLLSDKTEIVMQHMKSTKNLKFVDNLNLTSGYILNYKGNNYVKGYLSNDRFFGKVLIDDKIYCVEPIHYYPQFNGDFFNDHDAVIFLEPSPKSMSSFGVNNDISPELDYQFLNMNPYYGKFYNVTKKTCSLLVAIDNSFVQVIGKGVVDRALPRMILNLDEANSILRSADFDGDGTPDDIGVELKTVLVLSSKSPRVGSIIETPIDEPVNPKVLLKTFTTLEPLKFYCLAILFTAQPFHKRLLGVSFTPSKSVFDRRKLAGICAPWIDLGFSLNTLAISHKLTDGSIMPTSLAELNLAHELAHAFGSEHDNNVCEMDHIMQPKAGIPNLATHLEFSNCSKLSISTVLRKQGHCLRDNTMSFCGNGIVEDDEECDCGSSTHCLLSDKCCVPRSLPRMCTIKNGVQCHPSQGICCNENCEYRNLQHLGLDCDHFNARCPCNRKVCNCGVMGTCIGAECHSSDCTRLGLKECFCPKQIDGYCRTCCVLNGNCTPAISATRQILKKSKLILKPNRKYIGNRMSINVTVCNGEEVCFELDFRKFRPNGICTLFGKIGICSYGVCKININEQERSTLLLNGSVKNGFGIILLLNLVMLVIFLI